ncbi:MAG: sensor histidine kinase [Planctomycetota bacterium]
MDLAQVIALDAKSHPELSDQVLLDLIRQRWSELKNRPADQFLSILDRDCNIVMHSLKPEVVGQSAAQNKFTSKVCPELSTVGQVVESRQDCVGITECEVVCEFGPHLAMFVAVPQRQWTLALHRSRAALRHEIRSGVQPLFVGLIIVCGILMPVSLFLLWWTFCRVQRRQQKIEHQREELLIMLEAKKKELQSIVYAASHDLKTPLVNIGGFGGMLRDYCTELKGLCESLPMEADMRQKLQTILDEDIEESLGFIQSGVTQVHVLLDGLLKISRAGSVPIQPQPVDMNRICEELLEMMQFQCQDKRAEITVDSLPDCVCDPGQIKQIMMNLLDNALKYLDPDRPGRIHVSGKRESDKVIYCVEDNGIGIEPQYFEKVFEIYYRLNASDAIKGEGLGLAIVRRILDRYNGQIRMESELGKGSRFYVILPYDEE